MRHAAATWVSSLERRRGDVACGGTSVLLRPLRNCQKTAFSKEEVQQHNKHSANIPPRKPTGIFANMPRTYMRRDDSRDSRPQVHLEQNRVCGPTWLENMHSERAHINEDRGAKTHPNPRKPTKAHQSAVKPTKAR